MTLAFIFGIGIPAMALLVFMAENRPHQKEFDPWSGIEVLARRKPRA